MRSLLAALCAVAGVLPAHAADPKVTQAAFCITRTETGCGEVALSGTVVDFSRLQTRADGTHYVSFFSIQDAAPNSVFVHVVEAEDAASKVETAIVPANGAKLADLNKPLADLGTKFKNLGYVLLTPFRAGTAKMPYRVFSEFPVRGPGEYHGSVVDIAGKPLPGGERVSFAVKRDR